RAEKLQPKEVSPESGQKNFSRRKSPQSQGRKTSAEGSLPTVWAKKLQPKEVSPRSGQKNFSRRKSPHGQGRKTSKLKATTILQKRISQSPEPDT
ncbi:MAG: hypothetical protein PHQ65_12655, partial [Bacteroidales bacterium]|nr:hypothetical protein [Bacteroidales bacterium]